MPDLPTLAPVLVRGLPPIWGTPSPSPFVIKLETWLRMAGIAYEARPLLTPPRSRTGKIPYVEMPDGRVLHDSALIIETLGRERGVDLDAGLDPAERARGHAIRRMIEDGTYFVGLWERWISDAGFAATGRDYFRHLPFGLRHVLPHLIRRNMRANLHGQGAGRLAPADLAAIARADIGALSNLLGEREYILGRVSTVDATVFAFVWAFSANPFESALKEEAGNHPNLGAYLTRMRARYWADGLR